MPDLELSNKLRLHYLDTGPGEAGLVLLLHGLGATGDSWQLQIPELAAAGYRVIAPDARGFGRSTYPGGTNSVHAMAADMSALLASVGAAPADVVGISMGGTIALQLAIDHPAQVRKLVLVNTFARLLPNQKRSWTYFLWRAILVYTLGLPAQAKAVAQRIFPHPDQETYRQALIEQILQANPAGYRSAMRALASFNVLDRLPDIRLPTLVITGAQDTTVAPENQRTLVECIPGARQEIIQQAGHAASIDQTQKFNQILLAFLNEDPR